MTTLPENLRAKVEAERNLIMNRCLGYEPELNAYTPWNYVIAGAEALWQILVEGEADPITLNGLRKQGAVTSFLGAVTKHYEAKLAEKDAAISQLKESEARLKEEFALFKHIASLDGKKARNKDNV